MGTVTAPFRITFRLTKNWPPALKWLTRLTMPLALIGITIFLLMWVFYSIRASKIYDKSMLTKMPARTVVYDRNHQVIGYLHGDNRYMVKFKNVSNHFIYALIAREDARFYSHGGVDIIGLARSAKLMLEGKRQGGSTLSMQLADNTFNYNGKSFDGKFLEMALARKIEADFTKKEILEMYMNRIFWGGSIRGIEAASRTYFEKSAAELTLSESAMLAGIISAPNAYSPFKHLDRAIRKRDITLRSMVKYTFITQKQADEAMKEEIHIRPPERRMRSKSYAMSAIEHELDIILDKHNIKMGGLTVTTTLDLDLQKTAEQVMTRHFRHIERRPAFFNRHQTHSQYSRLPLRNRPAPQYLQGALICLENHTGAIVSIVGGRDPRHSEFNRAIYAKRQIGSIFKPFVYLAAFDRGMKPSDYISDERIYPNEITGASPNWHPRNHDGKYRPSIRVSEALAQSRNTSSIRVGNFVGLDEVIKTARKAGFRQYIPRNPSIYLGSFSATPLEVATAYTAFANDCLVYRPYMIQQITDSAGNVVYKGSGVIAWDNQSSRKASRQVSAILEQVTRTGTARAMRTVYGFHKDAAGKTGTTNGSHDGWFAGYTTKLTCAVWVGMDDNSTVYPGAAGASLALPIWTRFMLKADQKFPAGSLKDRAIIVAPSPNQPPPKAIIVE